MTAATLAVAPSKPSKVGAVLRVTSGNFLEQFDFFPVSYTHLTLPTILRV